VSERRAGLVGAVLAAVGLAVSIYLTSVKLAGALPVCGPLKGCEDVALSPYSEIQGIPVALFGAGFSALMLLLALAWWRAGDRRALLASYGLGLFGILFVAYLTYLELFVIHAVCVWCVAYALTVIVGWIVAAVAVRQSGEGPG
jgi:uncharacterized membrane protein